MISKEEQIASEKLQADGRRADKTNMVCQQCALLLESCNCVTLVLQEMKTLSTYEKIAEKRLLSSASIKSEVIELARKHFGNNIVIVPLDNDLGYEIHMNYVVKPNPSFLAFCWIDKQ